MQASPHPAGCWGGEEGQKEREGDQGRGTPWAAGTILEPPAKQRGWEVMGWERDLKAGLSVHTQHPVTPVAPLCGGSSGNDCLVVSQAAC